MKRLLFIIPAALLIAAPSVALANSGENHNQEKNEIEIRHGNESHSGNNIATGSARNHDIEGENENEGSEHSGNRVGPSSNVSIKTHDNKGQNSTKVSIKIKGLHGSTDSATNSATPSAQIKISGPLDQVIQILAKVLDFLKSLI